MERFCTGGQSNNTTADNRQKKEISSEEKTQKSLQKETADINGAMSRFFGVMVCCPY
jgi:hypothetical protein